MKPKKDYHRSRLAEEAARKAAEEEAERERLAAAAEEAKLASLAKIAEEEAKLKRVTTAVQLVTDEDKRRDLVNWLKSVPLSKTFNRVDRDFSNGVLVAELIHYYSPWICDTRFYFDWNSTRNKLSNWEALNYKVFPKLGFRLSLKQIYNILNPFSCGKFQTNCERGFFIYKLLFKIRSKLAEINPTVYDYRSGIYPHGTNSSELKGPPKRELRNALDHPCYSKIELLIASGYYDDKFDNEKDTCKVNNDSFPSYRCRTSGSCWEKSPVTYVTPFTANRCFTFHDYRSGAEICIPKTFSLKGNLIQSTSCL